LMDPSILPAVSPCGRLRRGADHWRSFLASRNGSARTVEVVAIPDPASPHIRRLSIPEADWHGDRSHTGTLEGTLMTTRTAGPKSIPTAKAPANSGARRKLTDRMIRALTHHFSGLDIPTLGNYTFEQQDAVFPGARSDFDVYGETGGLVFKGREFNSGEMSF